jgi:hypothetical protein
MTSEVGDLSYRTLAQAFAVRRWTNVLQNGTSCAHLYKLNNSEIISGVFPSLITFYMRSGTVVEAAVQSHK